MGNRDGVCPGQSTHRRSPQAGKLPKRKPQRKRMFGGPSTFRFEALRFLLTMLHSEAPSPPLLGRALQSPQHTGGAVRGHCDMRHWMTNRSAPPSRLRLVLCTEAIRLATIYTSHARAARHTLCAEQECTGVHKCRSAMRPPVRARARKGVPRRPPQRESARVRARNRGHSCEKRRRADMRLRLFHVRGMHSQLALEQALQVNELRLPQTAERQRVSTRGALYCVAAWCDTVATLLVLLL